MKLLQIADPTRKGERFVRIVNAVKTQKSIRARNNTKSAGVVVNGTSEGVIGDIDRERGTKDRKTESEGRFLNGGIRREGGKKERCARSFSEKPGTRERKCPSRAVKEQSLRKEVNS